jgi:hypothetical protein
MSVGIEDRNTLAARLAALHYGALSEIEFSKQLGVKAIEAFYAILLNSPHGRVFYTQGANGEILSLCCIFSDYQGFLAEVKRRLFPLILRGLLTGSLKLSILIAELRREKRDLDPDYKNTHLGMIASNSNYGPAATKGLIENYGQAIEYAKQRGIRRLWASTLITNRAALDFLLRSGFSEVHRRSDAIFLVYTLAE